MGGFDGFKQFIEICPSPYHGVNLCLGCMAESVEDPLNEVPEIIRYLGSRDKISSATSATSSASATSSKRSGRMKG